MQNADLRAELSVRARARIAAFAWDEVTRRYEDVYRRIME
jgi:glycosyltransferase involved in cell wall biosynthesis